MSLEALGTDYVDCMLAIYCCIFLLLIHTLIVFLIHWPVALNPHGNDPKFPKLPDGSRDVIRDWDLTETWRQMEEIYASGKVKAIGVSNWSEPNLELLEKKWKVVPAVNQVNHPPLNLTHFIEAS